MASLLPGIIIETNRRVFARGAGGRVLAVDLANGRLLWEKDLPYTPLSLAGDVLAAWTPVEGHSNRFQVVWVDAGRGELLRRSEAVSLPNWVSVVPAPGRSFRLQGTMTESELVLDWEAGSFYAGGARPTQAVLDRAKREASGRVAASFQSGTVEERTSPPAAAPLAQAAEGLDKAKSWNYWDGASWSSRPLVVQDQLVVLELETAPGGQALHLKTWDLASGKALNGKPLTTGRNLWAHLTADRRHLLVHDTPQGAPGVAAIYQLPEGTELVEFEELPRPVAVHVSDHLILAVDDQPEGGETKRWLRALDPVSGEESWSLPLLAPPRFPRPR